MAVAAISPRNFISQSPPIALVSAASLCQRRGEASARDHAAALVPAGTDPTTLEPGGSVRRVGQLRVSPCKVEYTGLAFHGRASRIQASTSTVTASPARAATGDLGPRASIWFLTVAVEPGDEAKAREVADQAEKSCLVAASLDLPVDVGPETCGRPHSGSKSTALRIRVSPDAHHGGAG